MFVRLPVTNTFASLPPTIPYALLQLLLLDQRNHAFENLGDIRVENNIAVHVAVEVARVHLLKTVNQGLEVRRAGIVRPTAHTLYSHLLEEIAALEVILLAVAQPKRICCKDHCFHTRNHFQ